MIKKQGLGIFSEFSKYYKKETCSEVKIMAQILKTDGDFSLCFIIKFIANIKRVSID